jgi:hypothetical protein
MRRAILVLALVACAVLPAIVHDAHAAGATVERFVLEPTEMRRELGRSWYVTLPPAWQERSDDVDHPQRSTAVLLEDGRPLGPAHAVHATIREHGGGAYSHWLDQVYFSTSDGSDPRSNGREYVLQLAPPQAAGTRAGAQPPGDGGAAPGARTTE